MRADGGLAWSRALPARPSAVIASGAQIVVAIEGEAGAAAFASLGLGPRDGLRGTPGSALVALGADGVVRWLAELRSTRWVMVRAITTAGDDVLIGGAFAGTIRIGGRVVTAAGNGDGFWARVDRHGEVMALDRMGGDGFDAVTGVAALTDGRLAIAGTFTERAELGGRELVSPRGDRLHGDGFVAVLAGGDLAWTRTWGGERDDTGAGVVALAGGELAIAGTVSGDVEVAGRRLTTAGDSDGLVAILAGDGAVRGAFLVGGGDVDSLTAIAASAAGSQAVVAGRFSGSLVVPGAAVVAPGADAGFVALVDRDGVRAAQAVTTTASTVELRLAADATGWIAAAHAGAPLALGGDAVPAGAAAWRRRW